MTKRAANGDHPGLTGLLGFPIPSGLEHLSDQQRLALILATAGPAAASLPGLVGGAMAAPEGNRFAGASAGSRVAQTAGLGALAGAGLGGGLGGYLAGSGSGPLGAVGGAVLGAGLGGYGGYRLGKYLHWPTNAFEAQREKQERERRM